MSKAKSVTKPVTYFWKDNEGHHEIGASTETDLAVRKYAQEHKSSPLEVVKKAVKKYGQQDEATILKYIGS